jgi:phospholipid/cholesterol/gamma-HCH transport system permease protein
LLWYCLRRIARLANPMVRVVFLREVHSIGVLSMRVIGLLALAVGSLTVAESTNLLGSTNSYLYDILDWLLVSEAAPVLVALAVVGRSATVMATEVGLMRVRGEIRYLEQMRIDPRDYVVLPRLAAMTVSMLAATFYFQLLAILGGFTASALLLNVSFDEQMQSMLQAISPVGLLLANMKALIFGLIIGTAACFAGLFAGHTVNDISRAQVLAYMRSLTWVVAVDVVFALARFST